MEKQKFEDLFKDSFAGADASPSDAVWTNIELDLEKASGTKIKKRLLFFQLLAAASMVFAAGIGTVYYMTGYDNSFDGYTNESVSLNTKNTNSELSKEQQSVQDKPVNSSSNTVINKTDATTSGTTVTAGLIEEHSGEINHAGNSRKLKSIESVTRVASNNVKPSASIASENSNSNFIVATNQEGNSQKQLNKANAINASQRKLPALYRYESPTLKVQTSQADPGMVLLAKLRDEEMKLQRETKKKQPTDKLWASVGMAAGNYNPNSPTAKPNGMKISTSGTKAAASSPTAGNSYSVGASVGGKISKRFILQGGVSHLTQNSEYTSSTTMGQSVSLNEFTSTNTKTSVTSPYDVSSSLQFLSLPVQAGYILLDRSLSIQVNGGVATDFFLQGVLTSSDNTLDKVTYKPGSDSPYRDVNFSGLVGTEVSYKVGRNYRIAVNPGVRYALNSIYKSEVSSQMLPITFDVGLNFRYIFN
jgi:hypothetical protein